LRLKRQKNDNGVEREAARKAKAILSSLTLSTCPADEIIFELQEAASLATEGSLKVSSEAASNCVRAATALRAISGQLDQRSLAQEMLDCAKLAVEA
jgi:hypothetical protein